MLTNRIGTIIAVCLASTVYAVPPAVATDSRMETLVTVDSLGTDLGRLSAALTTQTGVRFRVQKDIAEEKIDVFVRDYTLGLLKQNIVRVFHYRWATVKGKDGVTEYLLFRDLNTRVAQRAARDAYDAWQRKHWTEALGHIKDVLAMSADEVHQLPPDDYKWAAEARFPSFRPWYEAFANLPPADLEQLYTDGHLVKQLTDGPPFDKTGFLAGRHSRFADAFQGSDSIELISSHRWYQAARPNSDTFLAVIRGRDGARLPASVYLTPPAGKGDPRTADPDVAVQAAKIFAPEDLAALDSDARLDKLVKAAEPPKGTNAPDLVAFHTGLQRIARATGVPIISDYYTTGQKAIPFNPQKAYNLLTLLCRRYDHQFARDGQALLFRHTEWPLLMDREVPLRTLDALEKAGPKGEINFEQSLIAAALSVEQAQFLAVYEYYPRWISSQWQTALYQFLASLSKSELNAVTGPRGMRTTGLLPHRAAALDELARFRGAAVPPGGRIAGVKVPRAPLFSGAKPVFEAVRVTLNYATTGDTTSEQLDLLVAPRKDWDKAPPAKTADSLDDVAYSSP